MKNTLTWPWAFTNLGILAVVGVALYCTHSLWSFIGLIFLLDFTSRQAFDAECPKCHCKFVVEKKDTEEDKDD